MSNEKEGFSGSKEKHSEENSPIHGAKFSESVEHLKDIGQKGIAPFINVIHKHRQELSPYLSAVEKGLRSGANSLSKDSVIPAEFTVRDWFLSGAEWVKQVKGKFEETTGKDLLTYIEEEAKNKPGLMFAVSYVAGLGLGRFGRHLGHIVNTKDTKVENTIH